MLSNIELYKWQLFESMLKPVLTDPKIFKIVGIFKSHDIPVDTAIEIMQEIAAVDQESKTNIVQFADILKAKEKK